MVGTWEQLTIYQLFSNLKNVMDPFFCVCLSLLYIKIIGIAKKSEP